MRGRPRAAAVFALTATLAGWLSCALAGLSGCFSDRPLAGPEPPEGSRAVAIRNFAYVPPSLSVAAGTVVVWTNQDNEQHTVTADDGTSFESTALGQGQRFQLTAPAPGTYTYHCSLHPFMTATLMVTAP